jgi:threonine/homoserine/homoserine lactone efflux protein
MKPSRKYEADMSAMTQSAIFEGFMNPAVAGLAAYALVSSITPGPNNILLASSGARFGLTRTLPHMLGIWSGMVTLLLAATAGLGAMMQNAPALAEAMKVLAGAALIYTAVAIARADADDPNAESGDAARPWSFWQGAGFQYLNPKAVMMAVTAVSAFTTPGPVWSLNTVMVIGVFMIVNMPCTGLWALAGLSLRRALNSPRRRKIFNWCMAILLLATVPLMLAPQTVAAT